MAKFYFKNIARGENKEYIEIFELNYNGAFHLFVQIKWKLRWFKSNQICVKTQTATIDKKSLRKLFV